MLQALCQQAMRRTRQRRREPGAAAAATQCRTACTERDLVLILAATLLGVISNVSAQQQADSTYVRVGDPRVNGLSMHPHKYRCKMYSIPYESSPGDTAAEIGTFEDRVEVPTQGRRPAVLDVGTSHTTNGTTVDSTLLDRGTLALISAKTRYWNGEIVTYKAQGRHVWYNQIMPDSSVESNDSTFSELGFLGNREQSMLPALAPLIGPNVSFRIPRLGYDNLENHFVFDTVEIHVTGSARYGAPGLDSADVWLVTFGRRQLWVAKNSGRILEERSGMGDEPRYERCVATP